MTGIDAAESQVIGIDLGGTAIKLGRFAQDGRCVQALTVPTPQPPTPEAVLVQMVAAIAQLDPNHVCKAIGVGTPGPADAAGRIARVAINLGWHDVPLADWLEAKTGRPTVLANDANCAGLGEYWLGAGQQFQDLVLLTLGTGVGGAVILDGRLFVGRQGTAAEPGLLTIDLNGPPCNSGNRGSLEQHVSVQAIRRRTGLEPDEVARRAQAGDPEAIAFWQTYGRELGAGIANLLYLLTPEAVILGGGVSAAADLFLPTLWEEVKTRVLPSSREGLQILTATLGNQAGMVGAAKLAWQTFGEAIAASGPAAAPASSATPPAPAPHPALTPSPDELPAQLHQAQLAYYLAAESSRFNAGFLARTSHELRSPLNGVIGMHQLILADLSDNPEEERDFVRQAHASALKMLALLDEVTQISKVQHGSTRLDLQPVSLAEVLHEVYQLTHLLAQNRNIRLTLTPPEPDCYVLADPRWFRQALVYLLTLPLSRMREGAISLTTSRSPDGTSAYIWVDDQQTTAGWSEPLDALTSPEPLPIPSLEAAKQFKPAESLSTGLIWHLTQLLIEAMQGRVELVTAPSEEEAAQTVTQLRCTMPCVQDELGDLA